MGYWREVYNNYVARQSILVPVHYTCRRICQSITVSSYMHTKRTAGGIQSVGKTSRDREASGSNLISARSNLFKCIEGGEADRRINNEANHKLKKKHSVIVGNKRAA